MFILFDSIILSLIVLQDSKNKISCRRLAKNVNAPTTTTIVPHSAAEQMYGGNLKLFAPEDEKKLGGKYKSKENDAIEADKDNASDASGGDNIKRIVM